MLDPNATGSPIAEMLAALMQQVAMNDNAGAKGNGVVQLPAGFPQAGFAGSREPFLGMKYPQFGPIANQNGVHMGYPIPPSWGPNLGR